MMPLHLAEIGSVGVVRHISGDDATRRHLQELGFVAGAEVHLISQNCGDIIVNVKGVRVALSSALAMQIMI